MRKIKKYQIFVFQIRNDLNFTIIQKPETLFCKTKIFCHFVITFFEQFVRTNCFRVRWSRENLPTLIKKKSRKNWQSCENELESSLVMTPAVPCISGQMSRRQIYRYRKRVQIIRKKEKDCRRDFSTPFDTWRSIFLPWKLASRTINDRSLCYDEKSMELISAEYKVPSRLFMKTRARCISCRR